MSALYLVALHYGHISSTIKEKEKICCPFHDDDTPSMVLDYTSDTFRCYGCGVYGSPLDYVQKIEKSRLKALTIYARITKGCAELAHQRRKKEREQDVDRLAVAKDYYFCLSDVDWYSMERDEEQEKALRYLIERGLDIHTVARYGIKVTYSTRYPIIVPLYDNDTFCGYVQRTFDKESKRKYLYNKGFSRATSLIGHYGVKDYVFVCEGIFDLIALAQVGYGGYSVALMGGSPTHEQINKLKKKGITRVVSCLDNDRAGEAGTEELKKHFKVKRIAFPDGVKDVAEISTKQLKRIMEVRVCSDVR